MIIFALGCVTGGASILAVIYASLRQPLLATILAGNAIVAAAVGIGLAIGGMP